MEITESANALDEQVYTPAEIAKARKLHPAKIRELFVDEPGVIRLGHGAKGNRRQYFTLEHSGERSSSRLRAHDGG